MGNCPSCFKSQDFQKKVEHHKKTYSSTQVDVIDENNTANNENLRFFTNVNCGGNSEDHDSLQNVTVYGPLSMTRNSPSTVIQGNNQQYKEFSKSNRWAAKSFGYNVQVPKPGTFKVSLVFCEIDKSAFATGKRVFSVSIFGNERVDINDIDVFAKSGKNSPYILNLDNIKADSRISVVLRKGKVGNPFISGISVQAMNWNQSKIARRAIGEPYNIISKKAYELCDQKIIGYNEKLKEFGRKKMRTQPSYMFHKSETKVRGLIVTFHDFSSTQYEYRIFDRYMYDQGYDIFNSVLSGHSFESNEWPKVSLKNVGKIQKTVNEHVGLSKLLDKCEKSPATVKDFFEKLAIVSSDFEELAESADKYCATVNDVRSEKFENIFDSSHMNYLNDALEQFDLIENYPGPVFVCGIGLGATVALSVSTLRSDRVERCIAMCPMLEMHEFLPDSKVPFINNIGPLELSSPISWYPNTPFPVASLTAAAKFGKMVGSSSKIKRILRSGSVNVLFILTEEDDTADLLRTNDFFFECGGKKSGHSCFLYPRTHKVPHSMLDPTVPMKGLADTYSMLLSSSDSTLPIPPTAKKGRTDYYTKSHRSTTNSRFIA